MLNRGKKLSLYIHFPFCKSKCTYCDFYSITDRKKENEYISALKDEILFYSKKYRNQYIITTIYIGGGTPSLISIKNLTSIINIIKEAFFLDKKIEFTIEVNPESINSELVDFYYKAGINRLSIGVQTFNNKILKILNRLANREIILKKLDMIKNSKFPNYSFDLIYGLPYQNLKLFKEDLKLAILFKPKHISLYMLMLKNDVPLYKLYIKKPQIFPDENDIAKYFILADKYLSSHKLKRYEISNFAKKNYISLHNLRYWLQKDYLGVGASATSTISNLRWNNINNISEYIKKIKNNEPPVKNYEAIDKLTHINERIMLNLRLRKGINLLSFKKEENIDLIKAKFNIIKELRSEKLIRIRHNHLYLTRKGIMVSNAVISKLIF